MHVNSSIPVHNHVLPFIDPSCQEQSLINGISPITDGQITGTAGTDVTHGSDKVRLNSQYPTSIDSTFWKTASPAPPATLEVLKTYNC